MGGGTLRLLYVGWGRGRGRRRRRGLGGKFDSCLPMLFGLSFGVGTDVEEDEDAEDDEALDIDDGSGRG